MRDDDPLPLEGGAPPPLGGHYHTGSGPFPVAEATPFHLAASASYLTPIFALAFGMLAGALRGPSQSVRSAIVIGVINLFILTCGILMALVALSGIRRHGKRGLLWPALVGILVNVLFIALIAATWLDYRRRAASGRTDLIIPAGPPAAIDYNPRVSSRITSWDFGPSRET